MSNLQHMTNANRNAVRGLCAARKLDAFTGWSFPGSAAYGIAFHQREAKAESKAGLEPPMT